MRDKQFNVYVHTELGRTNRTIFIVFSWPVETLFEMWLYWGNFWEMVSKLDYQSERILEDIMRGNFRGNGVKVGLST